MVQVNLESGSRRFVYKVWIWEAADEAVLNKVQKNRVKNDYKKYDLSESRHWIISFV
jgi:hypothetical protein